MALFKGKDRVPRMGEQPDLTKKERRRRDEEVLL